MSDKVDSVHTESESEIVRSRAIRRKSKTVVYTNYGKKATTKNTAHDTHTSNQYGNERAKQRYLLSLLLFCCINDAWNQTHTHFFHLY